MFVKSLFQIHFLVTHLAPSLFHLPPFPSSSFLLLFLSCTVLLHSPKGSWSGSVLLQTLCLDVAGDSPRSGQGQDGVVDCSHLHSQRDGVLVVSVGSSIILGEVKIQLSFPIQHHHKSRPTIYGLHFLFYFGIMIQSIKCLYLYNISYHIMLYYILTSLFVNVNQLVL